MLEEDVEDEEEEKYEYRLQTTERIFGPHLQPKLDKLEFVVTTSNHLAPFQTSS